MKKMIVLMLSLLSLGALAACGALSSAAGDQAAAGTAGTGSAAANGTPGPGDFQMSTLTKLLIGTFKLEGGPQAVTAQQAQALVPLWQAVQSLSQSDTAADAEMSALEGQIQGTFTPEQLSAVAALALTPQDMQTVMSEQGLSFGNGANSTPLAGGGFPGGDGFPGGGPGGTGFNPQDLSPEQQATFEARAAGRGTRGAGVPAPLVEALIRLLEARAA